MKTKSTVGRLITYFSEWRESGNQKWRESGARVADCQLQFGVENNTPKS